ncbi:MAG: acyltransferase family protein [Pseudomonadota bacterium]
MTDNSTRRYDIDALRVIAFGLLILYHCGMFYVADWGWHIKSAYTSEWLQEPMRFMNQWRMSLLFVISGLAVAFVQHRYTGWQLAGRRLWRLGVPLIFGMAVVVSPQPYYEALGKGIIEPGFFNFWWDYFRGQDFPGEAWGGENVIVWTWNHLWYLPYVLFYTLLTIPLGGLLRRLKADQLMQSLRGIWLILVPVVPLMLYGNFVFPFNPGIEHGFIGAFYAHVLFGTLFFYGYLIGRAPAWWQALAAQRRLYLAIGIVAYLSLRSQEWWVAEEPSFVVEQLSFLSVYINRWCWIVVLLAYGFQYLNRPSHRVHYMTQAIFPWYILHQTLTIIIGAQLTPLTLGPVIEPILVLGGTVVGCVVLYEFAIKRVAWLRPLFGMPIRIAPPMLSEPDAASARVSAA